MLNSKDRKSTRDKANISNPKVNRGSAPLTANPTSADCVQISLGPLIPDIPLGVYHTGSLNLYQASCPVEDFFFSKSALAQFQEFWNSSICLYEMKRKNLFKSTCPTGSFTCPGSPCSGKRRALPVRYHAIYRYRYSLFHVPNGFAY